MSKLYWSALAGALLLSATPAAAGVVSFVSAKGVNTGDCSSPASPCLTLGFAMGKTVSGGEIKIVDPGNYIAVTIDRSITITGVDGASLNRGSAGAAMTINAGATGVVTIQNLTFDGVRQGATDGLLLNSAGSLTIKNCLFQNFSNAGINLVPTATLTFLIENTVVSKIANEAIRIVPTGGTTAGALNKVSSINNGIAGLRVRAGAKVTVSDSVFSGNLVDGILVGGAPLGGEIRLTRSTLTNNLNGIRVFSGSLAESMGDNAIRGNSSADVSGTLTNVGTM